MAEVEKTSLQPPSNFSTDEKHPHSCNIIIVDDDPDVLELLTQSLTAEGHIVHSASAAAAALELVARGAIRPEILLTDYNLPNAIDGLELMRRIRAVLHEELPAIILTGDISREAITTIASENCVLLSKPVKAHELLALIERLVPHKYDPASRAVIQSAAAITYVIDDDPEIRATIRDVLEAEGRTVEDFDSAEAFLESYRQGGEGCLLIDAYLPEMSGISLLDMLRARGDPIPAILITGRGDVDLAVEAMRTGAFNFIEKPVKRAELLENVARAIEQSHDMRLLNAASQDAAARIADLTLRQREIMNMVLAGHPSKNIAADLGISQRTVENHRAAIMRKMAAKSLPELARTAQAATAMALPSDTIPTP